MDRVNWIETVGLELNTSEFSDDQLKVFCVTVCNILIKDIGEIFCRSDRVYKISVFNEFCRRNYRFMKKHQNLIKSWFSELKRNLIELTRYPDFVIYTDHFQSCTYECLRCSSELQDCSIEGIDMEHLKNSTHTVRQGCINMEYLEVMDILKSKHRCEVKDVTEFIDDMISKDFDIMAKFCLDIDFMNGVYLCKEKKTDDRYIIKYQKIFDYEDVNFYQKCSQDPAFVKTYSFDKIKIKDIEPSHVNDEYIGVWVMEYIEGDTISEIPTLSEEEKNELKNILKGLHSRGLYHGDIHDTNIMCRIKNGKKEFILIDPAWSSASSFEESCEEDLDRLRHCF